MIRHTKNTSINVFSLSCWPTNQLKKASCLLPSVLLLYRCLYFLFFLLYFVRLLSLPSPASSFPFLLARVLVLSEMFWCPRFFTRACSAPLFGVSWTLQFVRLPNVLHCVNYSLLGPTFLCFLSLMINVFFIAPHSNRPWCLIKVWPQIVILTSNESCNKQLSAFPQHAENTGKTMISLISLICDRLKTVY